MNILMLSDVFYPRVNGVSTSTRTFIQSFLAQGHNVTLIAPNYPGVTYVKDIEIIRIPSIRLPFDPEDRLMSVKKIKLLGQTLRRRKFDIIHIQTPFAAYYGGRFLARHLGIETVISYHTFFEAYFEKYLPWIPNHWLRALARNYSRKQCNEVDGVISPSHQMLEKLREYGVSTQATVIPTGLSLEEFKQPCKNSFRHDHDIPEDAFLLLYVGRVAYEKNIEFLLIILGLVRQHVECVTLLVAGEGPALTKLKKLAAKMNLDDAVMFIGYLDRHKALIDCYHASNVFVFASQTETQGLVLLEAMACGLPVVSTASMGSKDVLENGQGCLIAPLKTQAFASRVISLYRNPGKARIIAERGRVYVRRWRTDVMAAKMLAFYRDMLSRSEYGTAIAGILDDNPATSLIEANEG